jgi:hypothetical protein
MTSKKTMVLEISKLKKQRRYWEEKYKKAEARLKYLDEHGIGACKIRSGK